MRSLLLALSMLLMTSAAHAEVAPGEKTEVRPQPVVHSPAEKPAEDAAGKPADEADAACAHGADVLGVSRTIKVDTTGGPRFGEQYPPSKLLEPGEVVLTFDDGPHPTYTKEILAALAAQCTKATFFNVGEMVKQFPDVARAVEAAGHTIGTHTWSHPNLGAISLDRAKSQIETTINTENGVLAHPVAPFFRFPYLSDPKRVQQYLAERNIAIFGIDVDSSDYRTRKPERVISNVMNGLEKAKGGIILFHDIHASTAQALPELLKQLKAKGYKVVHLQPKTAIVPIASYTEPPKAAPRAKKRVRRAYRSRVRKSRR